jgi:hypothetical protein
MWWFIAALGLIAHVTFWGAGLALLVMPRRLQRWWPALAPMAGLTLQTTVVYWTGRLPLAGANTYAWPAEIVPVAFLFAAWRWRRLDVRREVRALARWWPVAAAQLAVLVLLLWPLVSGGVKLTSLALGSCDAGDYAAGVRVFQEFAPDDRTGVMAQAETVWVGSTTDFRTFWLRLNHFGPVAAMALNAAIFRMPVHEIVSVFTLVLPVLLVPLVFAIGRGLFRFAPAGALVLALAVAASPLLAYAVYQVAPAQLMAQIGVLAATWAAVRAFETARSWCGLARWTGVVVAAVLLVLHSYNFFLVAAFAPAVGWVGLRFVHRWELARSARWIAWLAACLIAAAVLAPERALGLWERLVLLGDHDFGWPIPGLRSEAWLGAVMAPTLEPARGWLWAGGMVLLGGFVLALALRRTWAGRAGFALVALAGPPLAGYAILMGAAAQGSAVTSYSAYKLLTVFSALLVGAFCPWLAGRGRDPAWLRAMAGALAALLLVVNFAATARFSSFLQPPALVVDSGLRKLAQIEQLEGVDAVNLRIAHFWSRIWANAYLLRKPHYFAEHTYEGRRAGPLRARFDLRDSIVRVVGPARARPMFEAPGFELVDRLDPWFVEPQFRRGWFGAERRDVVNWRWSEARPLMVLTRPPGAAPLRARVVLDLRATEPRELIVRSRGTEVWRGAIDARRTSFPAGTIELLAGENEIEFDSPQPVIPASGDARALFIALFELRLEVVPADAL